MYDPSINGIMEVMMNEHIERDNIPNLKKARNDIAAIQSLLPGLGHIYKGYYLQGIAIMLLAPFFLWSGILLAISSAGLGLVVPIAYWVLVTFNAYHIEDRRKHHVGIL